MANWRKTLRPEVDHPIVYLTDSARALRRAFGCWQGVAQGDSHNGAICQTADLHIGCPTFLQVFSYHFRFRSSEEYFVRQDEQLRRRHPVTWLRMHILVDRAERLGLGNVAGQVRAEWLQTGFSRDLDGSLE